MVLSGEVFGQKGVINEFRTPVDYIDFDIKEGKEFHKNLNIGWNTFILVYKGQLSIQDKEVKEGETVFFEMEKEQEAKVLIQALKDSSFVWIAGVPLKEPVVQYGPFVMNTEKEIQKAFEDYH